MILHKIPALPHSQLIDYLDKKYEDSTLEYISKITKINRKTVNNCYYDTKFNTLYTLYCFTPYCRVYCLWLKKFFAHLVLTRRKYDSIRYGVHHKQNLYFSALEEICHKSDIEMLSYTYFLMASNNGKDKYDVNHNRYSFDYDRNMSPSEKERERRRIDELNLTIKKINVSMHNNRILFEMIKKNGIERLIQNSFDNYIYVV